MSAAPQELLELFEYDFWANSRWLAYLEQKGWPEPDAGIFRHALSAQKIWALRCQGASPSEMPVVEPTPESLKDLLALWKQEILRPNHVVEYRRTTGEEMWSSRDHIAKHVVNHGSYHRGELRALCRSRGDDDFPETDFIGYVLAIR
jgi:uncharacterized damage-inducible protein DinB